MVELHRGLGGNTISGVEFGEEASSITKAYCMVLLVLGILHWLSVARERCFFKVW